MVFRKKKTGRSGGRRQNDMEGGREGRKAKEVTEGVGGGLLDHRSEWGVVEGECEIVGAT